MLKAKDNKRDGLMLLTINRNHKKLKEFAPFSANGSDKGAGGKSSSSSKGIICFYWKKGGGGGRG